VFDALVALRRQPDDHERLTTLAGQQASSVAQMVKLAVIEFLDRYAPADVQTSGRPKRQADGARDRGEQQQRGRGNILKGEFRDGRR
jgi:hypothetical protein